MVKSRISYVHNTLEIYAALRKTMLRAHRQAWAWQDEWHGLTMDDIREIERQTQLALAKKMGGELSDGDEEEGVNVGSFIFEYVLKDQKICHRSKYLRNEQSF